MGPSIKTRILKALEGSGLVNVRQLKGALKDAESKGEGDIINLLVEKGVIADSDLLEVLSRELGIPPIDMSRVNLEAHTVNLLPEKLARRYVVVPLAEKGKSLTLVVSDPADIVALDDVRTVTGCDVHLVLSTRRELQDALNSFYENNEEEDFTSIVLEEEEEGTDVEVIGKSEGQDLMEIAKQSKTAPIVKMVNLIIGEALKRRASDIHIEPQEKNLKIRYRIDGELHDVFNLPSKNQNSVLTRLKIMSNMDITENRIPQDGRFRIKMDKKEVDFRVSALPITYGNKMVLRALDKSNLSVGLETLGFLPGPLDDFKEALSKPFGIILVTGPTGSGKSTTLYSVLNEMNVPERNIITVEDPVEYQVAGITQIAVHPEIGLDFSNGLRAILRQSPDIIMVGEIRDFETADIAIKASLTGQMVLSTLHTNDSIGAITRLVNMGIEPFLVASSLVMACAQRLLRRICPHCKTETDIPKEVIDEIRKKYPEVKDVDKFYKGKGCKKCNDTGYRGRLGTLETLLIDDKIKEMINSKASENDIREYIAKKGVRKLRDNAMIKFAKGLTTLEEVMRAT
ncbi:MAG: GspE/PulE family protein [Candidatus Tantalella remota]|nr:GspE/PulE family protein [Candidatus Tantalella remota]